MQIFYGTVCFVYGLVLGSFLNVCIYRIPRGMGVSAGRSKCPVCGHTLSWRDLIPLVSRAMLKGKCRYCGGFISSRYSWIELLTGMLFVLVYVRFGMTWKTLIHCGLVCILECVSFIDLDTGEIPDRMHMLLGIAGVLKMWSEGFVNWKSNLLGIVIVSVPMLILAYFTGGFGGGDIKLMGAAGLFLGAWGAVGAFFMGALGGAAYGVILMVRKKASGKSAIAFGPYLCGGIFISALWFDEIAKWYLRLLFGS